MTLLVKNGRVIDPSTGTNECLDILIENGWITGLGTGYTEDKNIKVLDASGLIVVPGFIDIHVHLREPGQTDKETIATGLAAAAAGGFTAIACMPNTSPVNDNPEITSYILNKGKAESGVTVFPIAAITKHSMGDEPVNMKALVEAGVKGFSDDGKCVMNRDVMRAALEQAKKLKVPVIQHPEDHGLSGNGQVNEGKVSTALGLPGIPAAAEDNMVARDIDLQEEINSYLHLTHISTAGSLELVRQAKEKKIRVTADVTPHHLLLTEECLLLKKDSVYKMKPPLRSESDRLAMIKGIQTGLIDCIATDHAPHTEKEKNDSFEKAPFGIIGLETAFPLIYDRLVRNGAIPFNRMIELFSINPARILGLEDRGTLRVGKRGDLTILNLEKPFHITKDGFRSKGKNSPFIGWEGIGSIAFTVVGGNIVYAG